MEPLIVLNELQIRDIRNLARKKRLELGFAGETPIANDIVTILDSLNIMLLKYPIKPEGAKPAFSAALIYSEEGGQELAFIGLNTSDYFDMQVFALTHELYHYYTKTGSHLSRLENEEKDITEAKANRFAAEFLLPESVLADLVFDEFKASSVQNIKTKTLLRFIARVQCTWWLPYRSIVKRLKEINAISEEQYRELYAIDERDMNGEYGLVGKAINHDTFIKLNTATYSVGTSPKDLEIIIRNFEDNIVDEDKFADILLLFNRKPEDFGYKISATEEDNDEFDNFFNGKVD